KTLNKHVVYTSRITTYTNAQNNPRSLRIMFDLGAQTLHVNINQASIRSMAVAPYLFQQFLARVHLPWLAGHLNQEVEFQGCQGKLLARTTLWGATSYRVLRDINQQISYLDEL